MRVWNLGWLLGLGGGILSTEWYSSFNCKLAVTMVEISFLKLRYSPVTMLLVTKYIPCHTNKFNSSRKPLPHSVTNRLLNLVVHHRELGDFTQTRQILSGKWLKLPASYPIHVSGIYATPGYRAYYCVNVGVCLTKHFVCTCVCVSSADLYYLEIHSLTYGSCSSNSFQCAYINTNARTHRCVEREKLHTWQTSCKYTHSHWCSFAYFNVFIWWRHTGQISSYVKTARPVVCDSHTQKNMYYMQRVLLFTQCANKQLPILTLFQAREVLSLFIILLLGSLLGIEF